ncbi:MAG TPA: response regulator transcription factor, partial [Trichococcus flocculiformis]|nr:response regulator transcription factor [Trichococcus flocculiformis]
MSKILIVDDDREIVDLLSIYCKNEGYDPIKAYDGVDAFHKLEENADIQLIILDVMMPKKDGISVVRELREQNNPIPILMLSAKSTDMDKIQGLTTGADDYVSKPFNPLEVMARIKSLLRRTNMQADAAEVDAIEIGPLIIKKDSHEVKTLNGK